jgi:hypothetical protein
MDSELVGRGNILVELSFFASSIPNLTDHRKAVAQSTEPQRKANGTFRERNWNLIGVQI